MNSTNPTTILLTFILLSLLAIYYLVHQRNQRNIQLVRQMMAFFAALADQDKTSVTQRLLEVLQPDDGRIIEQFCFSIFKKAGFSVSTQCLLTTGGQVYTLARDIRNQVYLVIISRYKGIVGHEQLSGFAQLVQFHDAVGGYYVHAAAPDMVNDGYFGFTNIRVLGVHQLVALLSPAFTPMPN